MKTRWIQTRFYEDEFVSELSLYGQHLYMYLLTNSYINMTGMFQLTDKKVMFESKLDETQLAQAKQELIAGNKVFFYRGWIYVVNAEKNNRYTNSPTNLKSYNKEREQVPKNVLQFFQNAVDSSMDSSIDTTIDTSMHTRINLNLNINHKDGKKSEFDFSWLKDFIKRNDSAEALEVAEGSTRSAKLVFKKAQQLVDYCAMHGKSYVDYKVTLKNWVKKEVEDSLARFKAENPNVILEEDL